MAASRFVGSTFDYEFDKNIFVDWVRDSSKYTHTLRVYVEPFYSPGDWSHVGTRTGLASSHTWVFTAAEKEKMISLRAPGSGKMRFSLETFDAKGVRIGSVDFIEGKFILPDRSTINKGSSTAGTYRFGETYVLKQEGGEIYDFDIRIMYYNSKDPYAPNEVDYIPTFKGSTTWVNDSQYILDALKEGNKKSIEVDFAMESSYNGYIIRDEPFTKKATILAPISPPSWLLEPTVEDVSTQGLAITGDKNKLIQNISDIKLNIPLGSASPAQYSELVKYKIYVGNESFTEVPVGTQEVSLGSLNLAGSQVIKIHAIDNWGNAAVKELAINLIPYVKPVVVSNNIERLNGFEGSILGSVSGNYSPIPVNGVAKNSLNSVVLRYKKKNDLSFTTVGYYTVQHNPSKGTFSTNSITIPDLTEGDTYIVQVQTTDRIGNSTIFEKTIVPGTPIIFFDKNKQSIGLNGFPTQNNTLESNMKINAKKGIVVEKDMYASSGNPGISLNNSDITGANQIFFNDTCESDSEGIQFPKTGVVSPTSSNQCDSLRGIDGQLLFNSRLVPVMDSGTAGGEGVKEGSSSYYKIEVSVKFSKPFLTPPMVVVNARTTVPGKIALGEAATSITTTGFTIHAYRTNGTYTGYDWVALGY